MSRVRFACRGAAQLSAPCEGVSLRGGGAMTVAIERHERHGDPIVRGYVRHLMRAACAPLFDMVRLWVLHGELRDVHEEFFIEQRAVPLAQLWHDGIQNLRYLSLRDRPQLGGQGTQLVQLHQAPSLLQNTLEVEATHNQLQSLLNTANKVVVAQVDAA